MADQDPGQNSGQDSGRHYGRNSGREAEQGGHELSELAELAAELRSLGADLTLPPIGEGVATAVLDRIATEPVPAVPGRLGRALLAVRRTAGRLRSRWRAVVAALVALLAGLSLAPPVRAGVAELFGFGGVIVERSPGGSPSAPSVPPSVGRLTLDQARALVPFAPSVPAALGTPAGVTVTEDRRLLSMSWTGGPDGEVRLDQFDARLSPMFYKTVYDDAEQVRIGERNGLWFPSAHEVVVLGPHGAEVREPARLAGQTLVWEDGGTTLRLEGKLTRDRALEIARSAVR